MNRKILLIGLMILVIFGVAALFLNGRQNKSPQVSNSTSQQEITSVPSEPSDTKKMIIVATDFKFDPATISLVEGEKVEITFKNQGKNPHDFIIEGTDISTKVVSPGEEEVISFVAPKTGSYETFCNVGSHRALGMEGKVEVK